MSGILTGVLLGLARISGETAPLLFTALNNQCWSSGITCEADGQRAGGDFPVRHEPVRQLAFAGLGGVRSWSPFFVLPKAALVSRAIILRRRSTMTNIRLRCTAIPVTSNRFPVPENGRYQRTENHRAQSQFLLQRLPGAEEHQPGYRRAQSHRDHRSVGLRKIDLAARIPTASYSIYPKLKEPTVESDARWRGNILDPGCGPRADLTHGKTWCFKKPVAGYDVDL
jgi:hypothetical protein